MNHHFFKTNTFKGLVAGLILIILLLVTFRVGMAIGYRRALFANSWGTNYERNLFGRRELMKSHGTIGKIIKIDKDSIVVADPDDNIEKSVLLTKDTVIKKLADTITAADFKVNDRVAVIGSPNALGQIEAKLIRVMPVQ